MQNLLQISPWGLVTVPDRLHRVVYNAPEASAGYRCCNPWWRRSHHPGSSFSQSTEIFSFLLGWLTSSHLGCASTLSLASLSHIHCQHLLASHAPSLPLRCSLRLLLSLWRPVPQLCYIHPLMFITQMFIAYSWGRRRVTLWGSPKRVTSYGMNSS